MSSASPQDDQPLGLTVHSLPVPSADEQQLGARTRGGRWKMLMVLLVCASPVIASYITYYLVRPEGRRNFGELVTPQMPLPDLVGLANETVKRQFAHTQRAMVAHQCGTRRV